MKKWDYKVKTVPVKKSFEEDAGDHLAEMGQLGWELVNFQTDKTLGAAGVIFFVFKRPTAPEPFPSTADDPTH